MGANAVKEIAPLIPMVVSQLPRLVQAFQSTRSIEDNGEDRKIAEVLDILERDRNDLDQLMQNQAQLQRTYEGLNLLLDRMQNGEGIQIENGANGRNARGTPKLRIEMDLPENAEDREEAIRDFWRTLGRVASAYNDQHPQGQIGLANECQFQEQDPIQRENLQMIASAPPTNSNNGASNGDDEKLERFLTCDICTRSYNTEERRPILLRSCGHTFCRQCLSKTWRRNHKCPTCRKECQEEVDQLPTNYSIMDFMNEEKGGDLKNKGNKENSDCGLSFKDQIEIAKQLSIEDIQHNDLLLAQRLQEEEDRIMRFRQHGETALKGLHHTDEDSDDDSCRGRERERCFEEEDSGARRKERSWNVQSKTMSDEDDDDDCIQKSSCQPSYNDAREILNDLDDDDADCSRLPKVNLLAENQEISIRGVARGGSEAEPISLYEEEKASMIARAVQTEEENKARKRQRKMLIEQEELDTALALSLSMHEIQGGQEMCVTGE